MPNVSLTSSVQQFIIVGFPGFQDLKSKTLFSAFFLTAYLLICLGNLTIILTLTMDENLHKPMYVLVCSLAILDIAFSSVTVPRILAILMFDSNISFDGCFVQLFLFHAVGSSQSFLLMLMAYDRFVAICNPLRYPTIMTNRVILKFMHLYCELASVVRLACADISVNNYVTLAIAMSVMIIPLTYILYSYVRIIMSVLKIASSEGRVKAFSTCGTHLVVIFIFLLTAVCVHISNRIPGTSEDVRIMAAGVQNVIPPLMNPVIYCLRAKEIRDSFVKTLRKCKILSF
ncbi:olfactory receptor 6-like [Polypterus senegalus]|uniref:olfactory receptor 6-like n=1 Tax=Polypterus senegalus TaxID=55291 RepID=UPI0019638F8A|nr:olfactory receptor 6-like [Polypterus senegalus]